ncbi:TPA: ead/Ea22-like family protein [Enterobacter hormaechei subsp. steigerwaltii]|nr:ead/Ea22-like family protein [Enterobacter hormaechei subsp. steigerwaltii]
MINIDKRALREAAEKATSGKWERGDGNGNGGELLVYCDDALGSAVCEMTSEYNAIPKYQRINNLNFIAAANPATVLALLDELEAADKRIAELERNEIREEGNQFLVVRHPGKLPVVKHCAGELEGFLRQLLEHDPMATIDIVTHRYYGVGGQWVQDADEYLQMMAAAAGKGEAS